MVATMVALTVDTLAAWMAGHWEDWMVELKVVPMENWKVAWRDAMRADDWADWTESLWVEQTVDWKAACWVENWAASMDDYSVAC